MEQVKCSVNNGVNEGKVWNEPSALKSPSTYKTPVRQSDRRFLQTAYRKSMDGFSVLPNHVTPPSGLTKFIARNPFDADLTSRLHLSVISPTVFSKVSPKMSCDSPGFSWSVDELALIRPAKIEEFPIQQMHCTDPDLEKVAQAAIDKFFNENQIIPSPFHVGRDAPKSEMLTPSRPLEDLNMTRELHKPKKESWTQTVLSLPLELPKEVEDALKPYFTFNQDQNVEAEDANSSNNSLRRKLFFNHDDCTDDEEDETSLPLSPVRNNGSSPPQSGMLVHGTPLTRRSFGMERTHGTPYAGNISPPNMSPICNGNDMSCQSIKSRQPFAARLDFTADMSIDGSVRDEKELRRLEDVEFETNSSMLRVEIRTHTDYATTMHGNENPRGVDKSPEQNETTEMISQQTTPLKQQHVQQRENSKTPTGKNNEVFDRLKLAADWCNTHANESCMPENNTLLGHSGSGQQSTFNFAQDTGYQTYSMSNITGTTDNCSLTPIKQRLQNWNEKISSTGDEVGLSDWKENMKNMFSSTPSKYSRRREN